MPSTLASRSTIMPLVCDAGNSTNSQMSSCSMRYQHALLMHDSHLMWLACISRCGRRSSCSCRQQRGCCRCCGGDRRRSCCGSRRRSQQRRGGRRCRCCGRALRTRWCCGGCRRRRCCRHTWPDWHGCRYGCRRRHTPQCSCGRCGCCWWRQHPGWLQCRCLASYPVAVS